MLNKRIILSGLSIMASLAIMGGATFAFFTDSGTSNNNVFATGSIDMKLGNGVDATLDDVTATFGSSSMIPGGTSPVGTLNIKNVGSIPANHVDMDFTTTMTQGTGPGAVATNPMDRYLRITTLTYDGVDILPTVVNTNGTLFIDLEDLKNNNLTGGDLQNLSLTDTGVNHPLVMAVQLDITAPNDLQGDSVDVDISLTLDQGSTH